MKHKYSILAAVALAISACLLSGCASLTNSLSNPTTVKNSAALAKAFAGGGSALALTQLDDNKDKQERVAKIMVLVADGIQVAAQSEDVTPASLKAAIDKALCNESPALVTSANNFVDGILAFYAQLYDSAVQEKLANDVILSAMREILAAMASGVSEVALPYSGLSTTSTGT